MHDMFSMDADRSAIRALSGFKCDMTGRRRFPPLVARGAIAPMVRNGPVGLELALARFGMPMPGDAQFLRGARVTSVRHGTEHDWRRRLDPAHRCLIPFDAFSVREALPDGRRSPVWLALDASRPLALLAGIWTDGTSVQVRPRGRAARKAEGPESAFAFLTTAPDGDVQAIVGPAGRQEMPVILTSSAEAELWMAGSFDDAMALRARRAARSLVAVARGHEMNGVIAA